MSLSARELQITMKRVAAHNLLALLLLAADAHGFEVGSSRVVSIRPSGLRDGDATSCQPPLPQLLALRGGAEAATLSPVQLWLAVMRKALFPGNPARERAPYVPPAPPPAAAKAADSAGGDVGLNRGGSKTRRRSSARGGATGSVTQVGSKKEFDALLAKTPSKRLIVVDFFATWCGPCQQIAPKYAAMAAAMPQALFLKVDVDQCKDLSQQYGVQSMPTFKFIKGGKEVDEMKGAGEDALKEKIEALAGKPDRWASVGAGRQL